MAYRGIFQIYNMFYIAYDFHEKMYLVQKKCPTLCLFQEFFSFVLSLRSYLTKSKVLPYGQFV